MPGHAFGGRGRARQFGRLLERLPRQWLARPPPRSGYSRPSGFLTMLRGVKDEARRTVAGLLITITAIAAALAPVVGTHHAVFFAAFVVIAVVAAALAVMLAIPDVRALVEGRPHSRWPLRGKRLPVSPPPPVVPGTWQYTSDGNQANTAMRAGELVMPGTGYRLQPDDRAPWIRFVVLIACSPAGAGAEAAQIWADLPEIPEKSARLLPRQQPDTSRPRCLVDTMGQSQPGNHRRRVHTGQ